MIYVAETFLKSQKQREHGIFEKLKDGKHS